MNQLELISPFSGVPEGRVFTTWDYKWKKHPSLRDAAKRWVPLIALIFAPMLLAAGPIVSILKVDESTVTGTLAGLQDGKIVLTSPDAKIPLEDLVNLIPKSAGTATGAPPITSVRKLTGKVIGTEGSWNDEGNTRDKVFDGDLATYFDAPDGPSWVGLDLGGARVITKIKFAARSGQEMMQKRMVGGKFQGSTTADFSANITDFYTVREAPPADKLTEKNVSSATAVRYVRYIGADGSMCNIAEAEFWGRDPVEKGAKEVPGPNTASTKVTAVKGKQATSLPASQPAGTKLRILLGGEEQITGPLLAWSEKQLRIGTPYVADGGLDIPVESLHEVWKGTADQVKQAKAIPLDPGAEDAAFVLKENTVVVVRGITMGINGESLRFKFNDEEKKINLTKVVGIIFGGNESKRDPSLRQTVQLGNGDSVSGTWTQFDPAAGLMTLKTSWGSTLDIPFSSVLRVSSVNGRLTFLTDMKPVAVEQTPYFDRMLPYQINRSLVGGPLKLIDGEYRIGIAVHSRTVLTYDVDGQFEEFRVKVGFQQPEGKIGQAVVRVLGDGKTLYEDLNARGDAAKPAEVSVKISGVKMLTLEVDFGKNEDTGDRVVWANPKLLKAKK